MPSTLSIIAANATVADRTQFKSLWQDHLRLRDEGKIVYFLPQNMGTKMGACVLRSVAGKLSALLDTDIYIHFDVGKLSYRIGQVFDDVDRRTVSRLVFIHRTRNLPIGIDNPAPSSPAAGSYSLESYHGVEIDPDASQNNLGSSESKAEKIPKPRNMWIIYRQDKHSMVLAANPGMHTSSISTIISNMWRNESAEVRAHYQMLAEAEKSNHQIQYPEYKCSPRKSSEIKKRKRASKKTEISIKGAMPTVNPTHPSAESMQNTKQPSKKQRTSDQLPSSGNFGGSIGQHPRSVSISSHSQPMIDWESLF